MEGMNEGFTGFLGNECVLIQVDSCNETFPKPRDLDLDRGYGPPSVGVWKGLA
jgi:hypothetical protein